MTQIEFNAWKASMQEIVEKDDAKWRNYVMLVNRGVELYCCSHDYFVGKEEFEKKCLPRKCRNLRCHKPQGLHI